MKFIYIFLMLLLSACSSIKPNIINHYSLTQYSAKKIADKPTAHTLLVSTPEAVAGFQSDQMKYTTKPFALSSFTKNAWSNPPASMIYPLLIQSLQKSGYFEAVGSGAFVNKAEFRLDTQLLELKQDFTCHPSVIKLKMKAMVIRISDNYLLSARIFEIQVPCPQNAPYGGVVAANKATSILTEKITNYVIHIVN